MSSSDDASTALVTVRRDGAVGIVTMNNPERRNPLSTAPGGSEEQMALALLELDRDEDVRAVVITGAGPAFSAGGDFRPSDSRKPGSKLSPADQAAVRAFSDSLEPDESKSWALWHLFERYNKPLVAAVNGHAIAGGWEIALWCDIIIADERAEFSLNEITLGMLAEFGALHVPRAIGRYKSADLLYTGRRISAAEADRLGLVTRIAPHGAALELALNVAHEIVRHSLPVLIATRKALCRAVLAPGEWRANQRDFTLLAQTDASKEAKRAWADALAARSSSTPT